MKALAAALLLFSTPAAAQITPKVAGAEQAALAVASERGRLIHAYDRAAWLGTDDMLAKVSDPASKVAGYIADGPADAPRLIFFDRQPTPSAVYVAQLRDGKLIEGRLLAPGDNRTIGPATQRMIAAVGIARQAITAAGDAGPCENAPFNTVVLPPASAKAPVTVYFLTPQVTADRIPFGGHYAVDVTADGTPGPIRRFTNSCLALSIKEAQAAKDGFLFITHLRDPVPTEIHVFTSLAVGRPVLVGTQGIKPLIWTVDGDRIADPQPLPVEK